VVVEAGLCYRKEIYFWNVSTRLQNKKKLTYVDEIWKFSGIKVCDEAKDLNAR
jgi:hypothetical protein